MWRYIHMTILMSLPGEGPPSLPPVGCITEWTNQQLHSVPVAITHTRHFNGHFLHIPGLVGCPLILNLQSLLSWSRILPEQPKTLHSFCFEVGRWVAHPVTLTAISWVLKLKFVKLQAAAIADAQPTASKHCMTNRNIITYTSGWARDGRSIRCPPCNNWKRLSTGTDGYGLPPIEKISHSSTPYDHLSNSTTN